MHGALTGPALLSEQISLERARRADERLVRPGRSTVVSAADAVWSALPARIDLLAAEAQRVRSLAHSVGVLPGEHPAGDDLEPVARRPDRAARRRCSPTRWRSGVPARQPAPSAAVPTLRRYDQAARALEDIRREVEAVLHVRDDAEHRLLRLRDVLSRADRTLTEARAARGEVLAKIAASEVPAVSGPAAALHERLSHAAAYHRDGQWHRLSPLLDGLEDAGRRRVAAGPRLADRGHRAAGRARGAARPAGRVQGEGRHGTGLAEDPLLDRALRPGTSAAVERAVRPAGRRARGAALPAGPSVEALAPGPGPRTTRNGGRGSRR